MISFQEALQIVLQNKGNYPNEKVALANTLGRVLKEDLYTDRDFPPFNRVTMDGIAIQYDSFAKGQRGFKIEGVAAAGAPQLSLVDPSRCVEVMTGAMLPIDTDTVIRYEDVDIHDGQANILDEKILRGKNIHKQAEDRQKGELIIAKNTLITPAEIGIAATIGKTHIDVAMRPKAIILSTGDELVEIGESPLPHQIRRSNVHQIQSILAQQYIEADVKHLADNLEQIKEELEELMDQYDVIILSGGVSKGKFDFLPTALEELGVQKLFHKVKQRPGKPFWFGKATNAKKTVVFALPGNPVSSFMCTHRYILPWLRASMGLPEQQLPFAKLTESYLFKPDLTYFLQVKISYDEKGRIWAQPITGNGSGDLANLSHADAFLQLPDGKKTFRKGSVYPFIRYK